MGYIKNRNITENIRAIEDLLHQTDTLDIPGIMICIDFQKAFDSIDWSFLKHTLQKFNFGPSLIHWIQTFYKNISSCIINNGTTSRHFKLGRGVRQGDPLSPYLFILVAEILSNSVRQNDKIKGINLNNQNMKIYQYADDTVGILQDLKSAKYFLKTVEEFGKYSGLKLNIEKTEGLWIGANKGKNSQPLGISWPKNPIKILGIYMSYNEQENNKHNFEDKIKKCKQILNMWQTRNLTLIGRIQIIKTFIMSQFSYVTSVITIPDTYLKEINNLIFKFIWKNKKDKIKRNQMHSNIDKGGLKVPDIFSIVRTSRVTWIKRYITLENHGWKTLFEHALLSSNLNPQIILFSNFEIKQWAEKPLISSFYREVLAEWFKYSNTSTFDKDQLIWYNKNILIHRRPIFYQDFLDVGIKFISDLYDENDCIVPFTVWENKGLKNTHYLKWRGILSSISKHVPRTSIQKEIKTVHIEALNFETLT